MLKPLFLIIGARKGARNFLSLNIEFFTNVNKFHLNSYKFFSFPLYINMQFDVIGCKSL